MECTASACLQIFCVMLMAGRLGLYPVFWSAGLPAVRKKMLVIFARIVYKHIRKIIRAAASDSLCRSGMRRIKRHFHALSPIKEYKT